MRGTYSDTGRCDEGSAYGDGRSRTGEALVAGPPAHPLRCSARGPLTTNTTARPSPHPPVVSRDPQFELAAKEAADTITYPRDNEEKVRPIQITLRSQANPLPVRMLGAAQVSKMIKVSGIVISASSTRAKATNLTIQCRNCRTTKEMPVKPGLNGSTLPRTCDRIPVDAEEERCPIDPYIILPDKCMCVDQQTLKLQELPEMVPTGEMPRHMLLSVDRYLVDRVTAGTRCTVMGIYSIFNASKRGSGSPVRNPYLQVTGIDTKNSGPGRNKATFTPEEEEEMLQFSRDPDIYNRIWRSFAPSIYGGENIKKAISCLLFGGSAKELPDQTHLRGDINVLLLGDPGTAKSQLLKFAEKVAPIAVYTSGKGSSAAGVATSTSFLDHFPRSFQLHTAAHAPCDVLCLASVHAYWMPIGVRDPMLFPFHVFRSHGVRGARCRLGERISLSLSLPSHRHIELSFPIAANVRTCFERVLTFRILPPPLISLSLMSLCTAGISPRGWRDGARRRRHRLH